MKALKRLHIFVKNTASTSRLATTISKSSDFCVSSGHVGKTAGAKFKCSVNDILAHWKLTFENNSISQPKESIEHILAHCLNTQRVPDVYRNKDLVLSDKKVQEINALCEKRLKQMPVQYVIREWSFRNLRLKMSQPVFIPRPETEELVDIVSTEIGRIEVSHILDLCCGSGAIALSLLQEHPTLKATAVDRSRAACVLTKENSEINGLNKRLHVIHSSLEKLEYVEKLDIIVSNPPYVFSSDMPTLQAEIKLYEDLRALNGGRDGLDLIKVILKISSRCLNERGKLFLEVDPRHPCLLRDYLLANSLGLSCVRTFKDFAGKERFVEIMKV